jgi:hypothetical protein
VSVCRNKLCELVFVRESWLPSDLIISVPASAEADMSLQSRSLSNWHRANWKKSLLVNCCESKVVGVGRVGGITLAWKSEPFIINSYVKVAGYRFLGVKATSLYLVVSYHKSCNVKECKTYLVWRCSPVPKLLDKFDTVL